MKKYWVIFLVAMTGLGVIYLHNPNIPLQKARAPIGQIDSTNEIVISVVGDIMCHSSQYNSAQISKDSFNFIPVFAEVKPIIKNSDFTIGNLETVFAGKEKSYSGYPRFNSPDAYLQAIKDAGFNYLSTANNHALDRNELGVLRTIEKLKENNINSAGTYSSQKDFDSIRIYNVKGIKIAILPYTYGTNGIPIPRGKEYLISLIDQNRMKNQIQSAREKGAELIIVHLHYGEEYTLTPNNTEKNLVKKAIEFGADIIIGGHPHVLQPVDNFTPLNKNLDKGFIAYSMGNFISGQNKPHTNEGKIILLRLKKNFSNNKISLLEAKEINTKVVKVSEEGKSKYLIKIQ